MTPVCAALKANGMKLQCTATGVGSSKPLVSPKMTAADKQTNRRVLVQLAKCSGRKAADL